jgi:hypothetical protein
MKNASINLSVPRSFPFVLFAAVALFTSPRPAAAQQLLVANPHWNITLSDFGYSDYMLDNTPGFEGREYLCGEWAAAVGYQLPGGTIVSPKWFERNFVFPDWTNNSTFHVVTPLAQTGLNADNLPIAESVIANSDLEITLRYEMLDTVVGTPMGTRAASAADAGTSIQSDRYVLKQTSSIRNISGTAVSNVQFFQFLHGLNSQRGVYDDRLYTGPLSEFRYDATQAGVDAYAVGAGSSSAGLEDLIGFHASTAPTAYEIGHYGIEGNGVDGHAIGKPSDGVHLSIEDNWLNAPYFTRQGTDEFVPPRRWVAGAQRWNLGNLPAGQSVSLDVLLTLRTGTRVNTGTGSSGGCNGGSSVPGGVDYEFEDVSGAGSFFGEYSKAEADEVAVRISEGEFEPFTFMTPGGPVQLWELEFSGGYSGAIHLAFGYDATILPPGFNQGGLFIYQFKNNGWQKLPGIVNPAMHTIAVTVDNLSVFALGVESGNTSVINAGVMPAGSGMVTGGGTYADGSSVTLVATASAGYVFASWIENVAVVSASPSYTFIVRSNRSLTANFVPAGGGKMITTSALPPNGGSTLGDGAYAPGSSATVIAIPNPGYKFSKWLESGVIVSTSRTNIFIVTDDHALVAKFKPVYAITVSAEPVAGGDVEADPAYEFGELAKIKAVPNPGYSFVNWTQNGVPVSDDEIYQFNVTGNRELVAHFAFGHRIDLSAEPANAGTATGGGVYADGSNVTVVASANPGYVFLNWTENAAPVSASPVYSFISTVNRTLAANFLTQPMLNSTIAAPGALTLSWPAGANGWALEESPDLSPGSWTNSTRPVSIIGNQKQVTVSPLTDRGFFRLFHQ